MPVIKRRKRIILIGYKKASKSLRNLQAQLKQNYQERLTLRVSRTSTTYKYRASDYIIPWGPTNPSPYPCQQQEAAKNLASNKLKAFQKFKEHNIPTPEWTTSTEIAQQWVDSGKTVLGRKLLCSHSGKGIVVLNQETITTNLYCPLYVQYKKKKHEYRVHVFNGKVIDITQKKRKIGFENRNNQIRNHSNGWIYARENLEIPDNIHELALNACNALGLNSGAVDIIWNEKENKCYVLEINTAPGIEGSTCLKYSQAIIEELTNG